MNVPKRRLSITKESVIYEHYQEWDRWLKRIGDLIKRVVHLYLNHLDALKNRLKTI
jgi:hypothetical protein